VSGLDGGAQDAAVIKEAQEIYTILQECRNPAKPFEYDFADPETGEVLEDMNGASRAERLS
jgi:hypothetical protein